MLADAIKRAGTTDGPKVRDAIAATKDFAGVTGNITHRREAQRGEARGGAEGGDGKFQYVETIAP